jgi:hypothetical protein
MPVSQEGVWLASKTRQGAAGMAMLAIMAMSP